MIEKAGRTSGKFLRFFGRAAEQDLRDNIQDSKKKAEAWRAISDTDFAKYFIEECDRIRDSAYAKLSELAMSDMDQFTDGNLKSIMRAMQQRIIVINTIQSTFMPTEGQIEEFVEQTKEE